MPEFIALHMAQIAFPAIDPIALQIGPLAIHWYGLGYVVGILFAWWYGKRLLSTDRLWAGGQPPFPAAYLDDFVVWAAVGVVAGGRLGYVLFYDLARTLADPLSVFAIWDGGMSFHGGFLGVVVAMFAFAIRNGAPSWSLIDTVAAGVPVGLGLVRITNFINSELWGRPSEVPWAVYFPNGGPLPRHPSQLYEAALEGLVLFLVIRLVTHRFDGLKRPGLVAGVFAAGYGFSRILVEFFREPDAHIGYLAGGWLTMGMILSLPMVVVGAWLIGRSRPPAGAR